MMYAPLYRVSEKPEKSAPAADLSLAGGRAAPLELLRRHLSSAPLPFLEGALDNPALTSREMVLLLRNRQATPKLLLAIGRNREWTRSQEVKKLLVLHPRVPLATARNLLPHLYWKQLVEVAKSLQVNPVVRRRAEDSLKIKIEEMNLGEKVALARQATPRLISALSASREDRLLRALLGNGKMREIAAAGIAADDELPGELLAFIANHHRWGALRSIRLALLANPRTPIPDALQLLGRLAQRDLQRLARDDNVPRIISMGADRKLQEIEERRTRGD
jgi:hypothetical protein